MSETWTSVESDRHAELHAKRFGMVGLTDEEFAELCRLQADAVASRKKIEPLARKESRPAWLKKP